MIRKARREDISRIAEILVFVKRMKFHPVFQDNDFSFGELQATSVVKQYIGGGTIDSISVYDDGIVKGFIRIERNETVELYVDYFFQNRSTGSALIEYTKAHYLITLLWAIKKNQDTICLCEIHGFHSTDTKEFEEGITEHLVMLIREGS